MPKKVSDDDFISAFRQLRSPAAIAKALGMDVRGIHARRKRIEDRLGIVLDTVDTVANRGRRKITIPKRGYRALQENITGTVIIGGDLHAWPGERSVAFGALVELVKTTNPTMVIINGDVFDGARISRHPPGAWCQMPTVSEELDAVKERLAEIENAAPENCPLILPAGNHDSRFSSRLAQHAPEFVGVQGFDLADHLPAWQFCWSVWLNGHTVVKHRWHNGVHAAYNNVLKGGKNIITNHTHRLHATMYCDYNGIRWGIEAGTLSGFGPETDKYSYSEDNPPNWSEGFAVLTFDHNGMLLEPEFCRVINGTAYFRGQMVYGRDGAISPSVPSKKKVA